MKITFIIQDLFAQGAQYATAMMAKGFAQKGYDVDLIVSQYHNDYAREGKSKVFQVPENTYWYILNKRKARQNLWEIRKYLKHTDSYAVICMSPNYSQAVRVARVGLRQCPKIIHVEHGLAGMKDDYTIIQPPKRGTWSYLRDWMFWSGFDGVFTVSEHGRGDFARVHPHFPLAKITTVFNPVISDNFYENLKSPTTHPWLVDKKCFTFVTAGAHEEYKGHIYLLEAMRLIRDRAEKIRVVIFGKGKLTDVYRQFISENHLEDFVSLGGYTNNFPAEAKSADAFVLPSNLESFGIVIVEAMACGLPVISTDAPFGPREVLDNGRYGTLVPVKNNEMLANAMIALSQQTNDKSNDSNWKRFTTEKAVERYECGLGIAGGNHV